jgi:hypothetical protein
MIQKSISNHWVLILWILRLGGEYHLFGYPAVDRPRMDRWEQGLYIPHPNQLLPLNKGSITSWHVYLKADDGAKVSLRLQIWRSKDTLAYMLVGQTILDDLDGGYHAVQLDESNAIHFEAGDVIGLQFDDDNPVPYDLRQSCTSDEEVIYLTPFDKVTELHKGAVYAFKEKPDSWKACRMYSLYANFTGDGKEGID